MRVVSTTYTLDGWLAVLAGEMLLRKPSRHSHENTAIRTSDRVRATRAMRRWLQLIVAASGLALCFACPATTQADPIVDFPTGGPPGTAVYGLAPGANGAMWFAESPTGEGNQFEVAEIDSSGSITASAQLTSGGSAQSDTAVFVRLVPASDGGVWVSGVGPLVHISPSGAVQPISISGGTLQTESLVAGQEGSAWGLVCHIEIGSPPSDSSEGCNAIKVELSGQVTSYALPSFNRTFPAEDLSAEKYVSPPGLGFATTDGVWLNKPGVTSNGATVWEAVFVNYSGQATPTEMPTDARLIAPGAGDAIWWEQPAEGANKQASTLTLGQMMPNSVLTAIVVHNQESGDPEAHTIFDAGPAGNLLWAESTPSSSTQAGYMGIVTPQGETRYAVGEFATAVAPPTPAGAETWSLSPFVASDLYQAANGDIWVVPGGDPGRIGVLTPVGGFSTFLPLATGAEQSQIWDMQQSSTGSLWFSLDTPNVNSGSANGILARANPLSPPPGEPPFPGLGAGAVSPANVTSPARTDPLPVPAGLLAAPVLGQSQTVRTISGKVRVRLKGTRRFVPLLSAKTIPDGSEVDATHGRVELTAATPTAGQTESAEAYGGKFSVHQSRAGTGETHLTLSLALTGCDRATRSPHTRNTRATRGSAAGAHGAKSRHLWVSDSGGSWGTNGRYVSTTVEGTHWLTVDECNQSRVTVVAGKVRVRDLINGKTTVLTPGQTLLAR
jgi:hypothetical protein